MTKNEAKQAALRWIDEATSGGRTLEEESTADWLDRMDHLLDGAVSAVCGRFPHHAVYSTVCSPPRNLAPPSAWNLRVWPPDAFQLEGIGFSSYTLEVQGQVTLQLSAAGKVLVKRTVEAPDGFVRVSGVLEKPADSLRLTGEHPFLVRGVGLYPDRYPQDKVPAWQPYWPVQMPQDFATLEQVQYSGDGVRFERYSDYRRVGDKCYAVPRQLEGQLDFYYIRTPVLPSASADGATVLDVTPDAACLVPLRLAADLLVGVDETAVLSSYLNARYNEMAAALYHRPDPGRDVVECVYAQ